MNKDITELRNDYWLSLNGKCKDLVPPQFNVFNGREPDVVDLMLVGEAPQVNEVKHRVPFIGRSGNLMRDIIAPIMSSWNVYITNAVKCPPRDSTGKIINPSVEQLRYWSTSLYEEIVLMQPTVMVLLGASANIAVYDKRPTMHRDVGFIGRTAFFNEGPFEARPYTFLNYHPAAMLYDKSEVTTLKFGNQFDLIERLLGLIG